MNPAMETTCHVCDTTIVTMADTPLCSTSCKRTWLKETMNSMSDEEAECPLCKTEKHCVRTAVRHLNDVHDANLRRTETCETCNVTFIPSNWNNDNKYCSEKCFGLGEKKRHQLNQ